GDSALAARVDWRALEAGDRGSRQRVHADAAVQRRDGLGLLDDVRDAAAADRDAEVLLRLGRRCSSPDRERGARGNRRELTVEKQIAERDEDRAVQPRPREQ